MALRNLVAAAAIAVGSTGAMAATFTLDLSSGDAFFGNRPVAGGFTDTFTFAISPASTLTAAVISVASGTQDVDFDMTNAFITGPSGVFNFMRVASDPFETLTLGPTAFLTPGTYQLTLAGMNTASLGSYAGSIAVTPIPEPQTYALLLAGLLTVGFIARRRRD